MNSLQNHVIVAALALVLMHAGGCAETEGDTGFDPTYGGGGAGQGPTSQDNTLNAGGGSGDQSVAGTGGSSAGGSGGTGGGTDGATGPMSGLGSAPISCTAADLSACPGVPEEQIDDGDVCCTTMADTGDAAGWRAEAANLCGIDYTKAGYTGCNQVQKPGELDAACPDADPYDLGTVEQGCCQKATGACGTYDPIALGCRLYPATASLPACGTPGGDDVGAGDTGGGTTPPPGDDTGGGTGSGATGGWKDFPCDAGAGLGGNLTFLCEGAGSCPSGCTAATIGGGDYCFCGESESDRQDWMGADSACASAGMALVTIDDQAENDAVAQFMLDQGLPSGDDGSMWIGANDLDSEGNFVWADGTAVGFTAWIAGQPNDAGMGEDCTVLQASASGGSSGGGGGGTPGACPDGSFMLNGCCRYCDDFCECL